MGPFGIMNKTPILWTRKCKIIELYNLKGNHLKMRLDDGTGVIDAIKWNSLSQLKINDLIDIAFHIENNKWKKFNNLQLNLIDTKSHSNVIDLKLHEKNYKCQLTKDMNIQITNSKGESIYSDLSHLIEDRNLDQDIFTRRILSFAEIALGKTA